MRTAEMALAVGKLGKRSYPLRLTEVIWSESIHGATRTNSIELRTGFAVLVGGNGAGKSTLLSGIRAALDGGSNVQFPERLTSITCVGRDDQGSWTRRIEPGKKDATATTSSPPSRDSSFYIDAAASTDSLLTALSADDNACDLLEGVDPYELNDTDKNFASFILGTRYSKIEVSEVEGVADFDVLPVFSVEKNGVTYGSTEMGRGEISALYLIWMLRRISNNSIVLIEEPESHLAYASQERLVSYLIHQSVERGLSMIVSSHTPAMIASLEHDHIVFVQSAPGLTARLSTPARSAPDLLGLKRQTRVLAVVEDRVAALLLEVALLEFSAPLAAAFHVTPVMNGESAVDRVLSELGDGTGNSGVTTTKLRVVAIYDGDQRGSPKRDLHTKYLMGSVAPEEVLRGAASEWLASSDQMIPGVNKQTFSEWANSVDGFDHHDWFIELAKLFGSESGLMLALFRMSQLNAELRIQNEELMIDLSRLYR